MLAYVFWHRPAAGVAPGAYEERLLAFHDTLGVVSAAFRLHLLPWRHEDGYEDWYLVEDWAALGTLNEAAVAAARRGEHDAAAAMAGEGWAGIYALVRGAATPPEAVRWESKPRAQPYRDHLERVEAEAVWQRQMTLGPAPEFCLSLGGGPQGGRERVV